MADGGDTQPTASRAQKEWTTGEIARLSKTYPVGGIEAARAAVPGRSDMAIRQQAYRLGLQSPHAPEDPARLARLARLDADIRSTYEKGLKWGDIKRICERQGVSRALVYARVRELGLPPVQIKGKAWSDEELALLEETAHLAVHTAHKRFARAGFRRSPHAIQVKRSRRDMCIRTAKEDRGLRTTSDLAELLGVSDQTIRTWVREGLRAELRGTSQGGHYLVKEADLRRWIIDHPLRINLVRIPYAAHPWFITMLAGD